MIPKILSPWKYIPYETALNDALHKASMEDYRFIQTMIKAVSTSGKLLDSVQILVDLPEGILIPENRTRVSKEVATSMGLDVGLTSQESTIEGVRIGSILVVRRECISYYSSNTVFRNLLVEALEEIAKASVAAGYDYFLLETTKNAEDSAFDLIKSIFTKELGYTVIKYDNGAENDTVYIDVCWKIKQL